MQNILFVGNDIKIKFSVAYFLKFKGYKVTTCSSFENAKIFLVNNKYDSIITYIHGLPENAFAAARGLRSKGCFTPILYLGKKSYKDALVDGSTPLDHFLTVPFSNQDLIKNLESLGYKNQSIPMPLLLAGIKVDERHNLLSVKKKVVNLGKLEMKILFLLAKKAGQVVSMENLYALVEQEGNRFNNRVFSQMASLRNKLELVGVNSLKIHLVKGGYRLDLT